MQNFLNTDLESRVVKHIVVYSTVSYVAIQSFPFEVRVNSSKSSTGILFPTISMEIWIPNNLWKMYFPSIRLLTLQWEMIFHKYVLWKSGFHCSVDELMESTLSTNCVEFSFTHNSWKAFSWRNSVFQQ